MISGVEKVLNGRNFKLIKETRQGEFGLVYHCVKNKENKVVKHIRQEQITQQQRDGLAKYLSNIHKQPSVVATEEVFIQPQVAGDVYIVMEYCDGGNLYDNRYELTARELCEFMKNVLSAIDYFHIKKITNIGLRATSILLKQEGNRKIAKLCDFGVLRHIQRINPYSGVQQWAADSWDFCAVFYELATGDNPFSKEGSDKIAICKTLPVMKWLFEKMLSPNAGKVTTKELFKSIFQLFKPQWEKQIEAAQQTARKRKNDVGIKIVGIPANQPTLVPTKVHEETDPSQEHIIRILRKDCEEFKRLVLSQREELEVLRPYKIKAEAEKQQPGRQWQAAGTAQDNASLQRLEQENQKLNIKLKEYEDWVRKASASYAQLEQECKHWATECQRLEATMRAQVQKMGKEKQQAIHYFNKQLLESQSLALQANRNYWSIVQQWTDERHTFREMHEREIKKDSQKKQHGDFNMLLPEKSVNMSEFNVGFRP